jgi:hypothetical protein
MLSAVLFFAVAMLVLRPLLSADEHTPPPAAKALVLVGSGFLVLPNTLIALAPKHQAGIAWGEGYLPVYMSAVGVSLLVAVAIQASGRSNWVRGRAAPITLAMALAIGFAGGVNFDNNRVTVEALNRMRSYPAQVTAQALSAGLLASVPDGAWVLSNMATAWQTTDFYRLHGGKSFAGAVPLVDERSLAGLPLRPVPQSSAESTGYVVGPSGPPIYYLYVENSTRDAGYVLLSRVESATVTRDGVSVSGVPLRVYRTWREPPAYDWQEVRGWPIRPASYRSPETAGQATITGAVLASGVGWALQSVPAGWIVVETGFDTRRGRSWLDSAGPKWLRRQ